MQCKCSLNNDFKVIGLCNIKKFYEEISPFKDTSWNQIIISKSLKISNDKAPIKTIAKVYLNIKITSSKIIKTPSSDSTNIEGLKLTGKLLLISGTIYENVVYVSNKANNSVHSIKLKIPFSTYIIIDKNSDLQNDYFCIYPCVEDIFLTSLSEHNITSNIALFLFAHKVSFLGPKKLPNEFVFKNLNNEEISKIEFNIDDMNLIVTSTDKIYGTGLDTVFSFKLQNSNKSVVKAFERIHGNENANIFKSKLNGINFEADDKITIFVKDASTLTLTNFPNNGDNYIILARKEENFEIHLDNITPILTPNKITVNSKNDEEVLSINFVKDREIFLVFFTGIIPNPTLNEPYFTLLLKDENGLTLLESTLYSNQTGEKFKNDINGKSFNFSNYSLLLIYNDKNTINISNYPNQGELYVPNFNFNIFSIKLDSLEDISVNSCIKIINDDIKEMSTLYFIKPSLRPVYTTISTSTQAISTNLLQNNEKYIQYLSYSQNSPLLYEKILGKQSAINFSNNLDNSKIQINPINVLRLSNIFPNRIILENYKNQNEYKIGEEPEFLELQQNLLIPHNLNYNKIRLKNLNNSTILFIYFDKLNQATIYIEPYSTGILNTDSDTFSFKITDSSETTIKLQGSLNKNENANSLVNTFGTLPYNISKNINIGDILILEYSNRNLIEIFDFQSIGVIYNPVGFSQKFTISESGLKTFITPVLKNAFIFKNLNNEEMVKVEFGQKNNNLVVTPTDKNYGNVGTDIAFSFELNDSTQTKISAIINENENALKFANILNNFKFKNNDKITIFSKDDSNVSLTNFPNQGDIYSIPGKKNQSFLIDQNIISPILTPNKIIVKSKNNQEILTISFITDSEKFSVFSTGIIPEQSSNERYFTLILKNENGTTLLKSSLNSNESPDVFKAAINNKAFKFSKNSLTLIYKDKSKIEISNYPNQGDVYIPTLDYNIFLIKPNYLEDTSYNGSIKIINDSNKEMANLYFIKPVLTSTYTTIATSTQAISTNTLQSNEKYVQYLRYSENSPLFYGEILGNESAINFSNSLDANNIQIAPVNILRLSNRLNNKIIIRNYKGQDEYKVEEEPEFLKIGQNSLIPHNLNYNKIRLKNIDNSTILFIYFDKLNSNTIYIEPYSTGVINSDSDIFSFKITDPTETHIKLQGSINKNENADALVNSFSTSPYKLSKDFNIGDTLILEYSNGNLVEIFNFDTVGNIYNPIHNSQKFKLTENGLKSIIEKLENAFIFKNLNNEEMAKVEFDITNMKLATSSTGKNYGGTDNTMAFQFELVELNEYEDIEIITSKINKNENANVFKDALDEHAFKFTNYIALLYFNDNTKLILTNYPKQGENYTMVSNSVETFKITLKGLLSTRLPNIIILNDINNNPVIIFEFNLDFKTFSINSTGRKTNPNGTSNYFIISLYNADGVTREITYALSGNSDGSLLKSTFNDQFFAFGKILKLEYEERDKVLITNFPNSSSQPYTPNGNEEWFEITNTGLKLYTETGSQFLQNVILFKNFSNEIMNTFRFDKSTMKVVVTSTGLNYGNIGNELALRIKLNQQDITVSQDMDGDIFKTTFNDTEFNFGNIITLEYDQVYMIKITNFPNLGTIYTPRNKKEENFEITENGLIFK